MGANCEHYVSLQYDVIIASCPQLVTTQHGWNGKNAATADERLFASSTGVCDPCHYETDQRGARDRCDKPHHRMTRRSARPWSALAGIADKDNMDHGGKPENDSATSADRQPIPTPFGAW
jgi:hypothetical protein